MIDPKNGRLLEPDDLWLLLSVDFDAGSLTWLPRDRGMFSSKRGHARWNNRYAYTPALNGLNSNGYRSGTMFHAYFTAHRVIWAMHAGAWPDCIDHINWDRSDNRICNLRSTTHHQNMMNMGGGRGASKYNGVTWHKKDNAWRAQIKHDGKQITIGNFRDEISAARAFDEYALKARGEFARLNFPQEAR